MVASLHYLCSHCREADAGPSTLPPSPSNLKVSAAIAQQNRSRLRLARKSLRSIGFAALLCLAASAAGLSMEERNITPNSVAMALAPNPTLDAASSFGSLVRKRERKRQRAVGPDRSNNFQVDVTPPKTCQPMNITFNPRGGVAPYTIFVGFSQWFPYTIQLPASYADPDLSTWFYQFDVPVFRPFTAPSTPTPNSVVVVSDSTGNYMNSSSFQTVVEEDTSCGPVTGSNDFVFYSDPTITTCNPMAINWQYQPPLPGWTDPVDIFILRERAPPIHIPVTNSSAGSLNYTVALKPGTNIMLTMTDKGGAGGVSGQNTVGGSEYIGQECLSTGPTSTLPVSIPSPTSTLSNLRMPDYTGLVSSLITSDGVVSTATAVETYRHGTAFSESGLQEGGIAGLAVGIGLGAAILAAVLSWCVWRKRHGRRTLLWDVPRSVEGELSKRDGSGPIDQDYLRNRSKAMTRSGSATAPMLSTMSPTSDSSEDRDGPRRHMPTTSSDNSLGDPSTDRLQSGAPWISSSNSRRISSLSSALTPYSDHFNDHSAASMTRRGSETSSVLSNPFGNSHGVSNSTRSYWQPFTDHSSTGNSDGESLAMTDARFHSSARLYADANAASLYEPEPSHQPALTSRSTTARASNRTYVQHSDAGLLLDDSLEEEDLTGQIELPPQYDAVPRRRPNASREEGERGSSVGLQSPSASPASPSGMGESRRESDDDESEFWRSPAAELDGPS